MGQPGVVPRGRKGSWPPSGLSDLRRGFPISSVSLQSLEKIPTAIGRPDSLLLVLLLRRGGSVRTSTSSTHSLGFAILPSTRCSLQGSGLTTLSRGEIRANPESIWFYLQSKWNLLLQRQRMTDSVRPLFALLRMPTLHLLCNKVKNTEGETIMWMRAFHFFFFFYFWSLFMTWDKTR